MGTITDDLGRKMYSRGRYIPSSERGLPALHDIDVAADALLYIHPSVTVFAILCERYGATDEADRRTVSERVTCALIALTLDTPEPYDGLHEGCGHGC